MCPFERTRISLGPLPRWVPMKRSVPSKAGVQCWCVTVIAGSRAREICELQANTAAAAIKRAIREHGMDDPHQQKRLAAYRVG
jgi:hypothetical protein